MTRIIPKPRQARHTGKFTRVSAVHLEFQNVPSELAEKIETWLKRHVSLRERTGAALRVAIREDTRQKVGEEGYVLNIEGSGTELTLTAASARGIFYGFQTLTQISEFSDSAWKLPVLEIVDYPAFKYRGVVEGFYYEPWSWDDRRDLIEFMGKVKMNAYIYAPKDDPYHREKWRERYPAHFIEEFKKLLKVCSENFVEFMFAVSPGLSVKYSDPMELEILLEKMLELKRMGVNTFAVFLDDIPEHLIHEEDKKKFKSLAEAQAYFLNELYRKLKQLDPNVKLFVCPTTYQGTKATPYSVELGQLLNPEIPLMWTGPTTCSVKITNDDAKKFREIVRRNVWIWDNYPVNDYARYVINLGPIKGRSPDLYKYIEGIFSNPMNEAHLSFVPLATIADYLWNPEGYDPDESWECALKLVGGDAAESLKVLAELTSMSTLWPEKPRYADEMRKHLAEGKWEKLREIFSEFLRLRKDIREKCSTRGIYEEALPYLLKLELYSEAGLSALEALNAPSADSAWRYRLKAWAYLEKAEKIAKIVGEYTAFEEKKWMMEVIDSWLREILWRILRYISEKYGWPSFKPLPATNARMYISGRTCINIVDGLDDTCLQIRALVKAGNWVKLDLGEEINVVSLELEHGVKEDTRTKLPKYVIEVSNDGEKWSAIAESTAEKNIICINQKVRFIRLRALETKWCNATVIHFKPRVIEKIPEACTTMEVLRGRIENLFDRDLDTFIELKARPGEALEITVPEHASKVTIFQDKLAYLQLARVEGLIGDKWVLLKTIEEPLTTVDLPEGVKKIRIISTAFADRARIHEVYFS